MIFAAKILLGWSMLSVIVAIEFGKFQAEMKRQDEELARAWLRKVEHGGE